MGSVTINDLPSLSTYPMPEAFVLIQGPDNHMNKITVRELMASYEPLKPRHCLGCGAPENTRICQYCGTDTKNPTLTETDRTIRKHHE